MNRYNFQIIDQIDPRSLLTWAREQTLFPELFNGQPTKRLEHWRGLGVQLLNYGKNWRIFEAAPIEDVPLLAQLRDRYYPDANSCLLYHYPVGVGISEHSDKPVFSPKVILINLIDTQPDLFGHKDPIKFRYGGKIHLLSDGVVVQFNASVLHGLPPVKVPRSSLSFRVVEHFLPLAA